MAIRTDERLIGGRMYSVSTFPGFQALDVFEELAVLVGPAFGAMLKSGVSGEADFEAAAVRLFQGLGGGKVRALTRALLSGVTVELAPGKTPLMLDHFDLEYSGKLSEVFRVLAFAAEVQFADFFADAKNLWGQFTAPSDKGSPSSSPST